MGIPDETPDGKGAERERLREADAGGQAWRLWAPYVSARSWGTVHLDAHSAAVLLVTRPAG